MTIGGVHVVLVAVGTGLPCRVPGGCPLNFRVHPSDSSSLRSLQIAAQMRDEHERETHGYVHRPISVGTATYQGAGRAPAKRVADGTPRRDLGLRSASSF